MSLVLRTTPEVELVACASGHLALISLLVSIF